MMLPLPRASMCRPASWADGCRDQRVAVLRPAHVAGDGQGVAEAAREVPLALRHVRHPSASRRNAVLADALTVALIIGLAYSCADRRGRTVPAWRAPV